jgi:hypothetical protein
VKFELFGKKDWLPIVFFIVNLWGIGTVIGVKI